MRNLPASPFDLLGRHQTDLAIGARLMRHRGVLIGPLPRQGLASDRALLCADPFTYAPSARASSERQRSDVDDVLAGQVTS
jgi:hypothetical protein